LLKEEKQNEWYDEFLKLKKNYDEEYLKKKKFEDDKRKYKNVYLDIPYISISSLNVYNDINKNHTDIQEKTKSKTPSIRNSILKKNKTPVDLAREREKKEGKRYQNADNKDSTLINILEKKVQEKEIKEIELENSFKKVIEEKETEKNKMEETLKEMELQQQKLEDENKILKQAREKEKMITN
jgi:hypothetical protein